MCKCRVLHRLNPSFQSLLGTEESVKLTDFNFALSTSLPRNDDDEILNFLFEKTNNIDAPWGEYWGLKSSYRSTSVGDVIQIDEDYYQVKPVGFAKIQLD